MPVSRARYDDERRGRSVARGASMPAWRDQDRREEELYQPVCMRVSCLADGFLIGMKGRFFFTRQHKPEEH